MVQLESVPSGREAVSTLSNILCALGEVHQRDAAEATEVAHSAKRTELVSSTGQPPPPLPFRELTEIMKHEQIPVLCRVFGALQTQAVTSFSF